MAEDFGEATEEQMFEHLLAAVTVIWRQQPPEAEITRERLAQHMTASGLDRMTAVRQVVALAQIGLDRDTAFEILMEDSHIAIRNIRIAPATDEE